MSVWQLWIVGGLYAWTAIDLYRRGEVGLAVAFLAYAVANFGLIAAADR
jgi:hypothetical protein